MATDDLRTAKQAVAFKALFAPSPDMMSPELKDYKDKMQYAYDQWVRAREDNWLSKKGPKTWEIVGEFCKDNKMQMGVSVITIGKGNDFTNLTDDQSKLLDREIEKGIKMAKVTGHKMMNHIPGARNEMERDAQIIKAPL